jgi:hypothetical protein
MPHFTLPFNIIRIYNEFIILNNMYLRVSLSLYTGLYFKITNYH